MRIGQQIFHRTVLRQKLFCGFISHAWQAWDVVNRVSHHAQVVDDLLWVVDFKFFFYFFYPPNLDSISLTWWAIHKNIWRDQLRKIFIGGHHIHIKTLFFSLFGKGSDDIIGFITFLFNHGDLHGFEQVLDIGNSNSNGLGRFGTIRFVFGVHFGPIDRSALVKSNSQIVGFFPIDQVKQRVGKPHDGTRVHPFRIDFWVFDKRIIPSKNQGVSVK